MTETTSPTPSNALDPTSILAGIGERLDEIKAELKFIYRVPRVEDPEIWVIYKPLEQADIKRVGKRLESTVKNKTVNSMDDDEAELNFFIDVLAGACEGVFAVIEGKRYSFGADLHGPYTRFDQELGQKIGLQEPTVRQVVKKIFLTDGDIMSTADKLFRDSAVTAEKIEEQQAGE